MVFVSAFACGDSVSGMRSLSCCTMTFDRSRWWWFAVRCVVVVEFGTQIHSQVSQSLRVQSRN